MCKKLLPVILCGASLALGGFAFNRQVQVGRPPAPPRNDNSVPEHVAYNFLFRAAVFPRNKALAGGLPPGRNKALQEEAAISDAQYGVLEGVAAHPSRRLNSLTRGRKRSSRRSGRVTRTASFPAGRSFRNRRQN